MTDETNVSRRRFLVATGGAAGAAALAGCTGGQDSTPTAESTPTEGGDGGGETATSGSTDSSTEGSMEPVSGGTLQLINDTNGSGGFDPVKSGDTASGRVVQQLYDGLMTYPNAQTSPAQLLAEGYETSDDFTTYTFTIKDATFHNGDPVTAEDFVYSFRRLAFSPNSVRSYFILDSLGVPEEGGTGDYGDGALGVYAEDESTIRVELAQAFHATLAMLAYSSFAAHPKGIAGSSPSDEQTESGDPTPQYREFLEGNPVGAGPFQFENWDNGTSVEVSRFDDYHGQTAYLEGVHWQVIEDDQARYQYAMNQNADWFTMPTANYNPENVQNVERDERGREVGQYGPLQNDETVNYLKVPTVSTYYFGLNTAAVPKPVRQAIAYVTNQEQLASQVFKNRQSPAYHLTPPLVYPGGGNEYDAHVEESYPYGVGEVDVQGAQQVMEEAGYGEDNRFSFTFTHYQSQTWSEIAQILQQSLGAAYIDMEIEQAQFGTLLDRGREGNLEAYTLGWIADWPAPDNFLQLIYPPNTYTGETGVLGYVNWGRDEETEASQQAREAYETVQGNLAPTEEAQQARNEAYLRIEEANWEDVVFVNTFHGATETFWYDYLHRPKFGAMGTSRQKLNTTWKEESAQE
ncbi:ABC transporter substrate-binding protein [Salinirubellus sp. GCM10025818]|uniref:ABC transporter substrate-binding protein n=1 Tax=Salinirubellus TaxID=2162630 RepID=UPI0030D0F7C9